MTHHIHQQMEVLLRSNLPDCKEERTTCSKCRLFFRLSGYILYAIVDDSHGLTLHIEHLFHLSAHKLRNTGHCIRLVDGTLQEESVFQLTYPILLRQEIQVVNRKYKFTVFTPLTLNLLLIGRVPEVYFRQSFTEMLMIPVTNRGHLHFCIAVDPKSFGQEEMERQVFVLHRLIEAIVILGNLSETAGWIANLTDVEQYSFLSHITKVCIF